MLLVAARGTNAALSRCLERPAIAAIGASRMNYAIVSLVASVPWVWGCAASLPPPTQRLADAQAVERSAREVGANHSPAGQLALKNTQDQIAQAKKAMADGDNERADALLVRAQADGELALAQARETLAHGDRQEATQDAADQKATNIGQGAVK
jgi:Domain of unknown function (DUF4398)